MIKNIFKTVRGFSPVELVIMVGFGALAAAALIYLGTTPQYMASSQPQDVNVNIKVDTPAPTTVAAAPAVSRTSSAKADTMPAGTTLSAVKARGKLKVGMGPGNDQGWHVWNGSSVVGFEPDLGHAIAAAVFGDKSKVEFTEVDWGDRFSWLDQGVYDTVIAYNTPSFSREAFYGTDFGPIYYYTAIAIMQKNATITKIAVLDGGATGTTLESTLDGWMSSSGVTYTKSLYPDTDSMYAAYTSGAVDAVCDDLASITSRSLPNYKTFNIADDKYALATKGGDEQWSDIVGLSFWAMVAADQVGLTQANLPKVVNIPPNWTTGLSQGYTAEQLILMGVPTPIYGAKKKALGYTTMGDLLGLDPRWSYNIISQVGSYSDVFKKNFPGMAQGVNQPYPTGLLYPHFLDEFWIPGSLFGTNGYDNLRSGPTL